MIAWDEPEDSPWAHRTLIVRKLKGLESIIPVSIVHPFMGKNGWSFNGELYQGQGSKDGKIANVVPDPLYKSERLRDLYFRDNKDYEGRFTVPVVWDSKTEKIVSNESSEVRCQTEAFFASDDRRTDHPLPQHRGASLSLWCLARLTAYSSMI